MINYLPEVNKDDLDQEIIIKLEQLTDVAGMDITVTSGYRPGVNGIDHGIPNGPHMSHKAVDLRCHDSLTRYKILNAAFKVGFRRIGINSIHVHIDTDETKPQVVFWIEPEPTSGS